MSLNYNKSMLAGRLTAVPELKTTPSGVSVTSFTLAVNRPKPKEGEQQQADFINCVAWRSTAEFITRYFGKGSAIFVVGTIQTRSWQDQNGGKRYATEVVVSEAHFVESKNDGASGNQQQGSYVPSAYGASSTPQFEEIGADEDLPF